MSCGEVKLSKYLTQTFMANYNAMICRQVTLSGDAEWPKVADAVIEAQVCLPVESRVEDQAGFRTPRRKIFLKVALWRRKETRTYWRVLPKRKN